MEGDTRPTILFLVFARRDAMSLDMTRVINHDDVRAVVYTDGVEESHRGNFKEAVSGFGGQRSVNKLRVGCAVLTFMRKVCSESGVLLAEISHTKIAIISRGFYTAI